MTLNGSPSNTTITTVTGTAAQFAGGTGSLTISVVDDVPVVDDFLTDVNGRPERLEGDSDNVDSANHSGAKSPGFQQEQCLGFSGRHNKILAVLWLFLKGTLFP